ncbi:MAG: response regulator transcription factor [Erysipelotrichaceae bacterium]|nr:response regulator transcription factor [Erysipelotrichaceae bacterium]
MFKIIVIDDDVNLNFLIAKVLTKNGYQVYQCYNADSAYDVLFKNYIDLIITDIMMPGVDGYKFTESLRREKINIPILMITAKEEFKDKVRGFNAGADDYLVKPINLEELVLRVGAILRRAKINNEKKVAIGSTVLDYNTFTVNTVDEVIELPQKEFNILFKLFSYPNQIFTRTQLMNEFWGMLSESDERTIDVHINRLRDKFKENPDFEIVTVRGLGYKVVKKNEE